MGSKLGMLCKLMGMYKELFGNLMVFNNDDLLAYFKTLSAKDDAYAFVEDYFQFEVGLQYGL